MCVCEYEISVCGSNITVIGMESVITELSSNSGQYCFVQFYTNTLRKGINTSSSCYGNSKADWSLSPWVIAEVGEGKF